jgi:hypothetical protein
LASTDSPRSRRPTSLPPEEFRPATWVDCLLFAVSVVVSSTFSAAIVYRMIETKQTGSLSGPRGLAAFWAVMIWLVPAVRVLFNWRMAASAGLTDHTYTIRMWWHVQLMLSVLATLVVMSFLLLLRALCISL